ncbi:hypothetical protein RHSIM_Rhsim06G0107800 [Rhododendron simsii]|uniref:Uncharacterized protein n=1 Tax=Rhododendron simsii TaxID=118357 RepID=A0A834GUL6_RHOSS|nr:hypothetical protein RHSIM_Rhsim06G0107800 [Rhododendron simsii]
MSSQIAFVLVMPSFIHAAAMCCVGNLHIILLSTVGNGGRKVDVCSDVDILPFIRCHDNGFWCVIRQDVEIRSPSEGGLGDLFNIPIEDGRGDDFPHLPQPLYIDVSVLQPLQPITQIGVAWIVVFNESFYSLLQRIRIEDTRNDEWFKRGYVPAKLIEYEDGNLDDVDAVFDDPDFLRVLIFLHPRLLFRDCGSPQLSTSILLQDRILSLLTALVTTRHPQPFTSLTADMFSNLPTLGNEHDDVKIFLLVLKIVKSLGFSTELAASLTDYLLIYSFSYTSVLLSYHKIDRAFHSFVAVAGEAEDGLVHAIPLQSLTACIEKKWDNDSSSYRERSEHKDLPVIL